MFAETSFPSIEMGQNFKLPHYNPVINDLCEHAQHNSS